MAIDVMKRVTVVTQVTSAQRLIKTLHDMGIVELFDAADSLGETEGRLRRPEASTEESDSQLSKIQFVLHLLDEYVPEEKSFFEGLTPLPLVIEPEELNRTLKEVDLDELYAWAQKLEENQRGSERTANELRGRIQELEPFEQVSHALEGLHELKRVGYFFGQLPARNLTPLMQNEDARRLMAWEAIQVGEPSKVLFTFVKEDEDAARRVLNEIGWEELPVPTTRDGVEERLRELREDLAEEEAHLASIRAEVERRAGLRRPLNILRAFWESNRSKGAARAQSVGGNWVQVLCGYVRERDLPALQDVLRKEFAEAALTVEDPKPGEDVPVSITLSRAFKPLQLLIDLFGRPTYGTFDPSPFIAFNFYLFFGICFGDVFYGLLLVLLSLYLRRRTRQYEGVYNFGTLFLYAGVSTMIFGALLGSWFGDLWDPKYLGEGNILQLLRNTFFAGLDPLEKPLPALILALSIGMLNQFYGIALKVYGAARNRDWTAAVFDGMLWLIILPGLVIAAVGATTALPSVVTQFGLFMTACGAIGLVLTQGRDVPGIVGKAITGVVSLYGIMGTYGITAFVGDTLSYCRLLALGVTTSVVAMAINIMAGMLYEIPYVGPVVFVVFLAFGHLFNFGISVLGAFIHSMRLIFVEFFGRFYEGGARPFRPLGFNTPEQVLKKPVA